MQRHHLFFQANFSDINVFHMLVPCGHNFFFNLFGPPVFDKMISPYIFYDQLQNHRCIRLSIS